MPSSPPLLLHPSLSVTVSSKCNCVILYRHPSDHLFRAPKAKKENNKPKSAAAAPKPAAAAGGATKAAGRAGRKAGRAGRPKPKTVEELDAEMSEYFDPNAVAPAANTNGAPAPTAAPATGDATMEDEIM